MSTEPYYPVLEAEISRKGVKKKDIAESLGIEPRALSRKLMGETRFWWEEVKKIHSLFPATPIETLMECKKSPTN